MLAVIHTTPRAPDTWGQLAMATLFVADVADVILLSSVGQDAAKKKVTAADKKKQCVPPPQTLLPPYTCGD